MDFEQFYKKFEEEAKKQLSADLWDRSLSKGDPREFASELFGSDVGFTPEESAEEYVEMINTMKEQGEFDEAVADEPWSIEYKDIWDNVMKETFKTEDGAWQRYNELSARTHGDMSDILWVEEPQGPVSEDGSAASLGVAPNAARRNEEFTRDDVDAFTVDDPNYVDHALLGDDESIVIKVAKVPGTHEFKLVAMLPGVDKPEKKTIKTGMLIGIVDFYRELLDMPMENAITLIEGA